MEQSANEEECGICLDALKNPVALPCTHRFCSKCLNGWRSKYGVRSGDKETNTKCPLCREKIPPTKEMVAQLKSWRNAKSDMEAEGDVFCESYMIAKSAVERLENEIGDWTETIDYSSGDNDCVVLPSDIFEAAMANDIQKVLNWLGPHPVDEERINAKNPESMDFTLVHSAVMDNTSDLLSILLQLSADVDPVDAAGGTPLGMCLKPENYAQARLLLEWGADISNNAQYSKDELIDYCLQSGNTKLANLLESEFGGRRCEIINLPKHPDLIGKTCVVEKILPNKGRYKVVFEMSGEVGLVGPENLKRRNRTPDDCGYYIMYENGSTTRHEFTSREKCQAFVASLTNGDAEAEAQAKKIEAEARAEQVEAEAQAEQVEAEARAEEAAASLLAELDLGSSATDSDRKSKGGKKKGGKKGRK